MVRRALVYLVTNKVNGKQYVGITTRTLRRRWVEHVWGANHETKTSRLHAAIRKYGADAFAIEVLHADMTLERAKQTEILEIKARNCVTLGYNITPGGDSGAPGNKNRLGKTHSAETREKLRAAHLGRKQSPEWVAAVSASLTGRTLSAEHRKRISESLSGCKNPAFGKPRSPDVRRRIGAAVRGRKRPIAEVIAMSMRTRGEGHPQAKLDERAVLKIRAERGGFEVARRHAAQHGVTVGAIYAVWSGRTWSHVGTEIRDVTA